MEALNRVLEAVNVSAADYIEKNKQDVEEVEFTEPMNVEQLDALLLKGMSPDLEWDKMNREQKRRAKKFLRTYKKKMNLL